MILTSCVVIWCKIKHGWLDEWIGITREKLFLNRQKKRQLVTGLEFDPTDVGALQSTKTWIFDVAEAVYRYPQWSYQTNVDLKRNQIFIFIL